MTKIRGDNEAQEICKALGLDPNNIMFLQITCEVGKAVSVKIERFVDSEEVGILRKVISNYTLTSDKT